MIERTRTRATALAEWLHALDQPIYVVDDQRRIVFVNASAAAWVGVPGPDLMRQRCDYTAGTADPLAAAAAALCPPPEVFEGERIVVARSSSVPQESSTRFVEFIPLTAGSAVHGVLAVMHTAAPPLAQPGDAATQLHEQLQATRRAWREHHAIARLRGESSAMQQVRAQVALAANSRASVLVVGPTGSGRRTVARTIHAVGDPGADCPLIPLDAATLSGEQLRGQLASWSSRIEARMTGPLATLLIADVDQLPADAQSELCTSILTNAPRWRILATAREPLAEKVQAGEFREDLARAIATLTISLPTLSAMRSDIPLLAQGVLEELNAAGGKQLSGFASDALDALVAYAWPGELAELAKYIAECHAAADGPQVQRSDLPKRIHWSAQADSRPSRTPEAIQLETHLAAIERELIEQALVQAKGNKTRAAKLLGLTRPRLYRRMVQLGLAEGEGGSREQ